MQSFFWETFTHTLITLATFKNILKFQKKLINFIYA